MTLRNLYGRQQIHNLVRIMKFHCLSILVCITMPYSLYAVEISSYDSDRNGFICPEEFKKFIVDSNSKPVSTFDKNGNGLIDGEELVELNESMLKTHEKTKRYTSDYKNCMPISLVAKKYDADDKEKYSKSNVFERSGLLIRESYEEITFTGKAKPSLKVQGALISYTKDNNNSSSSITAKGAILRPITFEGRDSYMLVPSLEFNRLMNDKKPEDDIDSLVFRVGNIFEKTAVWDSNHDLILSLNPTYTTDSDFDLDVKSIEFSVEPVVLPLALGTTHIFDYFSVSNRFRLFGEWGKVYEAAENEELVENENFFRFGPKSHMNFWLNRFPRLVGSLGFDYLDDVGGDLRERKLFTGKLYYAIDDGENIRLEAKYTNGDTSSALEDEETFSIGFSFKM